MSEANNITAQSAKGNLTETMSFAYAQRYEFDEAKRDEFAAQM